MPNKKRIAILATDGFEQSELMEPRQRLKDAGYTVEVVSPTEGQIRGWKHKEWGDTVPVDVPLSQASPDNYDALVLPGGVANPDALRLDGDAVGFIRDFVGTGKPVAAICHAPWTLVEAGVLQGRTLTSWPSLRTDITNAGATWVDQQVVKDGNLITSRNPDDLPAFTKALLDALAG